MPALPPAPTPLLGWFRQASLTRQLLLLIAVIAIPLSLLSGGLLYLQYRDNRRMAETALVEQAKVVARLVDDELRASLRVATALAASSALQRGDWTAFGTELVAATASLNAGLPAGSQPFTIGVAGVDGRWITSTGPLGTLITQHDAPAQVNDAVRTGHPVISDLYVGTITGGQRIGVAVPIMSSGVPIGAIGIALSRQVFRDIVDGVHAAPGALASIQDRKGYTIARSLADAKTIGLLPMPKVLAALQKADAGLVPRGTKTLDGVPSTIAFAHAPASGFIVKLDIPDAVFLAPLRAALLRALLLGGAGLAAGLGLALLLARRVVLALRAVIPAAEEAAPRGAAPESLRLMEADRLAGELTRLLIGQRDAAAALAESEHRFRTLADVMPQLVWSAGADGDYDYFNARCHEFFGMAPGALDGATWAASVHPDDRARVDAAWAGAIAQGEPFELECRRRRHDGLYRWELLRAMPLCTPEGQTGRQAVLRWFGSSTDITEIVAARELSDRSHADLEALVADRTRELQDVQARWAHSARMDALGQLAGGIAHDFNNVLQSVLSGATLIERRAEPATARYARLVSDAAERGASITQRLLAFSRRSNLMTEPVDVAATLMEMREFLRHTLGSGIVTTVNVPPGLPPMLADKGQLETVLVNLATNARDALDGNGVIAFTAALELVDQPAPEHPPGLQLGTYIRLLVRDAGVGMDATTLERVCEPFFTTKPPGQGTGLGLAMAHGFAVQSGGGLSIESAPGQGTTVSLWLPVAVEAPRAAGDAAMLPAVPAAESARLLLVDDEPSIRDMLGAALEQEGFAVRTAGSAAEALEVLEDGGIDILITDFSMPGADGLALINAARVRWPSLPAILVTGYVENDTGMAIEGACSGAFSLLRKPVEPAQLAERAASLLHGATVG